MFIKKKTFTSISTLGKLLKIEFSSICNAKCVWCWMFSFNKVRPGLMALDSLKKIVDLNKDFLRRESWRIEPFFNGETLLNPQFFDMLDYIVANKVELAGLHTNLSVKINIEKLMQYPLSYILVNIGGITKEVHEKVIRGTDFDLVVENLKKMLEINNKKVKVQLHPIKLNIHQMQEAKDFFVKLGVRPKRIFFRNTGFILPVMASIEEKKYFLENVVSREVRPYLRFKYDFKKNDFGIRAKKRGCHFRLPCIRFDGSVTVCCHDQLYKINVGDALSTPLETIFSSKECKEIIERCKKQNFYFCKGCN